MSESLDQFAVARERRRAEWTERLDRFARKAAPQTRPFAEALVSIVQPPVGARVLDVATGTGLVAVEAALACRIGWRRSGHRFLAGLGALRP